MEPLKGHDIWKMTAPERQEIDWDRLQNAIEGACPFCGAKEKLSLEYTSVANREYYVMCNDCLSSGPIARDPEKAIEAWNTRS